MFRRLIVNNGKLIFTILLFTFILILFRRNAIFLVSDKRTTKLSQNLSSPLDATKSTISYKPTQNKNSIDNFIIFSPVCKIPRVDPFAAEVMQIFNPPKKQKCADQPEIFTSRYDEKKKLYIVSVNDSLIFSIYPNISDFDCSSREIIRGPKNVLIWKNNSTVFTRDWIVPHHVQGAVIECFEFNQRSRTLQRDAFAFIQNPSDRNDSSDAKRSLTHPNVIMLGIGSMSQMNFQRTMPVTSKFVRQQGWYEMLGYNRIGDSTFVNLFSLLSGRTPRQWRQYCNVWKPGCLDSLTYLWNHFHNSGYLTAFAEDSSVFGFTKPPVDYYLHPVLEVFDKILGRKRRLRQDDCLGRRRRFRYVLDYALELVKRFVKDTPKPLFGIFWMNSFSRDDFSAAANVDEEFVGYLERFKDLGLFEKAIVVLFSDQGQHRGPLMKLQSSFLEERLPMLHIYLPPWYRKLYPEAGQALDINRRRLSSTIDVHITVKDLMLQLHPRLTYQELYSNCDSLMNTLPINRDCSHAAISDLSCSCRPFYQIPTSLDMKDLARLLVSRINHYLSVNAYSTQCYLLKFDALLKVERGANFDSMGNEFEADFNVFRLTVKTRPKSVFFGKALCNTKGNIVNIPIESIERLNFHYNYAHCVNETRAKKFCICKAPK